MEAPIGVGFSYTEDGNSANVVLSFLLKMWKNVQFTPLFCLKTQQCSLELQAMASGRVYLLWGMDSLCIHTNPSLYHCFQSSSGFIEQVDKSRDLSK